VPANLRFGIAARFLQRTLELRFLGRFPGFAQARQDRKIVIDLLNRGLAVLRFFGAQGLALLPIGWQRLKRPYFNHD
jgi:hypothetical protein